MVVYKTTSSETLLITFYFPCSLSQFISLKVLGSQITCPISDAIPLPPLPLPQMVPLEISQFPHPEPKRSAISDWPKLTKSCWASQDTIQDSCQVKPQKPSNHESVCGCLYRRLLARERLLSGKKFSHGSLELEFLKGSILAHRH